MPMANDWVKIYESQAIHLVEIVKGMLEDESIKTFIINKTDSMHIHLSNGDIELYVQPKEVMKAKHLIKKNLL
jgi:hypothetical protein